MLIDTGHAATAKPVRCLAPSLCLSLTRGSHLDDTHQNLVEEEQDEVKNWFETQMTKAKRFQPLAVLNQKFKDLDVFESNAAPRSPPPPTHGPSTSSGQAAHDPAPVVYRDPDEEVTRAHWQRPSYRDACSDPMCRRPITAGSQLVLGGNSAVNCRSCGRLFCEEHTMYRMKLWRDAKHDPVRGFWCRVCETCYKSREGYNDHRGVERDHFSEFASIRRKRMDREHMEISRLQKRLSKLTQLLANPPPPEEGAGGSFWPLSGAKAQRKALEQSVIAWEEDAKVSNCPFCQQEFSNYTFRRHHCRMCGRVVCGDPKTACSSEVALDAARGSEATEKAASYVSVDVRMCKDCQHTLFSKTDFDRELAQQPVDQRAYQNLTQFERGIRLLLPRFQKLLRVLQDPETPPTTQQLADAAKVRKRLTDAFTQYKAASMRIRDLPTQSPMQIRLQKAIWQQANNFMSTHMLPLQNVPKTLKHATPNGKANGRPGGGALASIRYNDIETGSIVSSSSAVSALESEEKDLRERLIVLEEQKFMVSEMVSDATKHRRFDEVSSLAQNLEDLNTEIDQINNQLGQLDFAGAYRKDVGSTTPG
jgi:hypothetical protein